MRTYPKFYDFCEISAKFDSQNCINGQHQIRKGDRIGYARPRRRGLKGSVCCSECWAKWVAENKAADLYEAGLGGAAW